MASVQNTPDLPIEVLQTQLKFTLWFIGILLSIVAFFIIRSFAHQTKKDDQQDKQIEKLEQAINTMSDVAVSIKTMLAGHDADIRWLIKTRKSE